jgi:hypothetical protein
MPEFFDLSFLLRKENNSKDHLLTFFKERHGLIEGENGSEVLGIRGTVLSTYEDDETDYYDISLGLPEIKFVEEAFDSQLLEIHSVVEPCFQAMTELEFVVCSYEMNPAWISDIFRLRDFNESVLKRFPISFARGEDGKSTPMLNLEAQDIFTDTPIILDRLSNKTDSPK